MAEVRERGARETAVKFIHLIFNISKKEPGEHRMLA